MKYAIVHGERREAEPGLSGECPLYGHSMIAKCGQQRVHHWAHLGKRTCDPWWENETEWHRHWKSHFPKDWQEIIQYSESGEKHVADVKTRLGNVLEFQNSFLREDEREAREDFYPNMLWVINGLRRKLDRQQFFACFDASSIVSAKPTILSLPWKKGALLREWGDRRVPVYFDFGTPTLWRLSASSETS